MCTGLYLLSWQATLSGDEDSVSRALETIHSESVSILQYNNENSLSCALSIAYYSARRYYRIIRELPTGKGFADLVFLPLEGVDKPCMIVELKYGKSAKGALAQIKARKYPLSLKGYAGEVVLVGIKYDTKSKKHSSKIERMLI